jgi:hypothetical protein
MSQGRNRAKPGTGLPRTADRPAAQGEVRVKNPCEQNEKPGCWASDTMTIVARGVKEDVFAAAY